MKLIRTILMVGALAGSCLLLTAGTIPVSMSHPSNMNDYQDQKYKIFCIDGEIEIETSTPEELHKERQVRVCQLSKYEYDSLADARNAAKRFGGVGAPCRCE